MRTKPVKYLFFLSFFGVLLYACLEPFEPSIPAKDLNVLVVDGYINAGPGKTRIVLSKVSTLQNSNQIQSVQDASVSIISDNNESYSLAEFANGVYESGELNLPTDKKYRLDIKLANGKEYQSELMSVKITPLIDTIVWEEKPDQLYLYGVSHDETASTLYYKWWLEEDWEIRVKYLAYLKYNGDTIILREEELPLPRGTDTLRDMSICFKSGKSNKLNIASTRNTLNDSVKQVVRTLSYADERVQVRYSMLLYQRTLTEDEYNYLELIEKNSTQMGSFFDPMPSQLFGNIKQADDPNELVIGYVGVYTTVSKRLFLHGDAISKRAPIQEKCPPFDFPNEKELLKQYLSGKPPAQIPYKLYYLDNDPTKPMVQSLPRECMDCRSSTTVPRPDYWREFFVDP